MWYHIIPWAAKQETLKGKTGDLSLLDWNRRMNELFDPFFDLGALDVSRKGLRTPALDVVEHEKEIQVSAEVPGFGEKEVQVRLDGDTLTIAGNKNEEREEKNTAYHWNERRAGHFERKLSLPEGRVDKDRITAVLKNGVLNITLPKVEGASAKKMIEVKAE